jgi:hypothetical protein
MICKVRYIENQYRKKYPALADRLTTIYNDAWKEITSSKLFRKYGDGDDATYLFSSSGTAQNQKQRNLIDSINKKYGGNIVKLKTTSSGMNSKITIDVHPIAEKEFNKLNPQQVLFSKKGQLESSKASPKTLAVIKDFLNRIGVDMQTVDKIVVDGVRQDANGAALIMQKLLQVVEGKDDIALPEEAMHFAVEILEQKDPALFNQLLKEIGSYRMLQQVIDQYSSDPNYQTADGKPNIRKLKKEAIAKVLAEVVIGKAEGVVEKPELMAKAETWWQKIINFFKNLFVESGFDTAAIKVLTGEGIGTAEDIRAEEGEFFLQTPGNSQAAVYQGIKNLQNQVTTKDEVQSDGTIKTFYYINGKKVPRRVSDLVQDWYTRRFKASDLTKSEYAKSLDEFRMEKGTKGHSDIQYAFSRFVDENGYLRPKMLDDSDYTSQLDPYNRDYYEILRDNLEARLNSFPPNTRFMAEVTIYDEKRGIAGTVDFLAIEESGKVNILDWKFMDINLEKSKGDIPWYKVNSWNLQMDQYKSIIKTMFSLKDKDFKQTRMIPIRAVYEGGSAKENVLPILTSVEIGDVNIQNIQENYLIPVGLEKEETGNKKIDKLLEKLNAVYKQISNIKALPSQKLSKAEQLNALFSAIRQLQMKQNIVPLIYQAKVLNKQIQTTIDTYNSKWKGTDPKSFSMEEIDEFTDSIIGAQEAIQTYATLDTDLKFLFQGELSEEDKKLREDLRDAADNARDLNTELLEVMDEFADKIVANRQGISDILKPEKIVRGFAKWFSSTSITQVKAIQVLYRMANKAFGIGAQQTLDETKKLQTLQTAYEEWAKSKGLVPKNYFDILMKKGENKLIDQYDPQFYKELTKNVGEKNFDWIKDNIDISEYNKFLKERLEKETEYINEKARVEEGEAREKAIQQEITKAERMYDTSTTEGLGWLQYDLIKKFPKEKWESAEWKELKNVKPAKDFYDYIIERNNYYQSIGYIHAKEARVFLPWVRKGMMEKLIFGGKIAIGEQFLRNISVDEGDLGYGETDPLTGRPVNRVPIYLTRELETDYSTDLFRNMALYNEMAIKFKQMSDIEAQARLLISVERNKKAIATSRYGKTITNEKGELEYTPDNTENTQLLEDMVKGIVYGQKYIESETFDQLLGKMGNFGESLNNGLAKLGINSRIFPENIASRQFSVNKVLNQINNTYQINALGFNVLSALSNLFGGTAQSIINAGTYFTHEEFAATEYWMTLGKMTGNDKDKRIAALEYFLPLTDNYNKEIAKTLSISKLSQENIQEFLMILMRKSDLYVQSANFFSFLSNTIIVDGEVVNAREYLRKQPDYQKKYQGTAEEQKAFKQKFEDDVKKLIEDKGIMKVATIKDGKLEIPGVERSSDSVLELRRKVQSLSKAALGNLSEDDIRKINLNIYGKSFMLFKNWIPRLVDVRYGNLKFNAGSDAYEWGRMRNVFRIMSEDVRGSLSNLYNTLQGNEKGVDFMRKLFEKKKADYESDTGKELEMDEVAFMDLNVKNVKAQLLDTIFLLTLVSLYAGVKAYAPDDDELSKNQHRFFVKATDKLKDELLYFYNPTSILNLVSQGFFPAKGLIENYAKFFNNFMLENYYIVTGDEKAADKNFVIKYGMKAVPGLNQFASWLPMFYPQAAKDLGIRAQAQYGFVR